MKTYRVTKKQIIAAVISEPLTFGKFFESGSTDSGSCRVCAVGAVLRKSVKDKALRTEDSCYVATRNLYCTFDLTDAHALGNFLSILSTEHECFAHTENQKTIGKIEDENLQRLHLLSVIEAFCPETVEFSV